MSERMERPTGISATAVVMFGFLLQECLSFPGPIRADDSLTSFFIVLSFFSTIGPVGIWCYWNGHNWARRLVLTYSAFNVWYLTKWDSSYLTIWQFPKFSLERLLNTLQILYGAFLLYWLNTSEIQAFFGIPKTDRPHNRFVSALHQIGIWGSAVLLLLVGILLGGASNFIRYGLSRVALLILNTAGILFLACLLVGIYYKVRKDRKTRRRFVFFAGAWTFVFGFLLITQPSPLRTWLQYHGIVLTRDRQLHYAEAHEKSSSGDAQQRRHLVEVRYNSAEEWHQWEIKTTQGFGPVSPLLAMSLEDTADLYRDHDQYAKAEPLYRRSLAVWEKALGRENRFAASVLESLADVYSSQGLYAEAEPLYQRSLAIRQNVLGSQDLDVATSLEQYSSLLHKIGRDSDAANMEARAKKIRANHPAEDP